MRIKLIAVALSLALLSLFIVMPKSAAAQGGNPMKNISVTDTAGNLTNGTLDITRFAVQRGKVVAIGTLKGTVNGQQINEQVTLPVTTGEHSCQILKLDLGPLHLDLLGLVVDLSPIHLNITAQQGSGNLLGNLLCDVAKLLDGNGRALGRLANLLNQILGALG